MIKGNTKICYHSITYELGVIYKVHREVPSVIVQNKRLRILRAIKKGQSRKTGNIEHAGRRQTKQNKNTIQYVLDTTI
jgi:hypothetical protein